MFQRWHALLFAHWPVAPDALRGRIPAELELDLHDGRAWIGVVPFRMSGVRLRALPPLPGASAFPELNVRTYVRHRGVGGVWFFSLDAASRLAVRAARAWFHLPYFAAEMEAAERDGWVDYRSRRTQRGAPGAELRARYRPVGPVEPAAPGSLEDFLTARYCLFARGPRGLLRGDIHHLPWPLRRAEAEIERETMTAASGVAVTGAPHLAFAQRLDVVAWAPRRLER